MKRSRFTLIEMLTVIAIIGILAGIAIPVTLIARAKGQETQAKNDISAIMTALKSADKDYGRMIGTGNKFLDKAATVSGDVATVKDDTFYAMIAELAVPKNSGAKDNLALNKRKKTYLETKKGFNPDSSYAGQEKSLYQDPWGKPYVVLINVKKSGKITVGDSTKIAADVVAYSWGPNGTDDSGCNADLDTCTASGVHKNHDDIASWNF